MKVGKVKIEITGKQTMGEETDSTTVNAEGLCGIKEDGYKIDFVEEVAENMKVWNRIFISEQNAVITKGGAVKSEMIFIPGKESEVLYQTPYGLIDMKVICESIQKKDDENGCQILILYDLYSGEYAIAKCKTKIVLTYI